MTERGMIERRVDARRRVLLGGLIETAAFLPPVPCTVRNVSLSGVRIEVAAGAVLPSRLVLHVPLRGQHLTVCVVWREGSAVGLRFEGDLPAPEPGPATGADRTKRSPGVSASRPARTLH